MREQVLRYIRERNLLKAGDRVAVAVSGGADSVALLRLLVELRNELGIVLFVAHFNHQLRGQQSDADERFVGELAARHNLPFFAGHGDVRRHAEAHKQSLEHAARFLRYSWLIDQADDQNLGAIATAHSADDQAETVLMKFLRGASTRGLAGIYPLLIMNEVPIIRPLLETSRASIECYLKELGQPWCEDRTNLDMQRTRNRIRHELLPLLERDYNPNLRKALCETAEVARGEEGFWQSIAGSESRESGTHSRELRIGAFDQLHVALQRRLLKRFLECNGIATEFHHIETLRRCALGEIGTANLPGNWLARREEHCLHLIRTASEAESEAGYECQLPIRGCCTIPQVGLVLQAVIVPAESAALEIPGTLLRLGRPVRLTVRNWRPGDRFRPAHSAAEEKLKRLFAEKRIPVNQRPLWPVALNEDNQIVWVRGFPVAHDFAWIPGSGDAIRIEALPYQPPPGTSQPEVTPK